MKTKFSDAKLPRLYAIEAVIKNESHVDLVKIIIAGGNGDHVYLKKEDAKAFGESLIKLSDSIL